MIFKRTRLEQGCLGPDDVMTVLSQINHFVNIKSVVKEINKLEVEDRKSYKGFVIGAVNGRETSQDVLESLRKLARSGGYEKEFDEVNSKYKFYTPTDWNVLVIKNLKELDDNKNSCNKLIYDSTDRFYTFPYKLLYKVCDFSKSDIVWILGLNLGKVEKFIFKKGGEVKLNGSYNMPKELDFSMCREVDLSDCCFIGVEKIILKSKKQKVKSNFRDFEGNLVYLEEVNRINNPSIYNKIKDFFR